MLLPDHPHTLFCYALDVFYLKCEIQILELLYNSFPLSLANFVFYFIPHMQFHILENTSAHKMPPEVLRAPSQRASTAWQMYALAIPIIPRITNAVQRLQNCQKSTQRHRRWRPLRKGALICSQGIRGAWKRGKIRSHDGYLSHSRDSEQSRWVESVTRSAGMILYYRALCAL